MGFMLVKMQYIFLQKASDRRGGHSGGVKLQIAVLQIADCTLAWHDSTPLVQPLGGGGEVLDNW